MRTGLGLRRRVLNPLLDPVLGTITRVVTAAPAAALTFDDGPHPDFTPRLLAVLARHHARATFFMVGEAASRHPELVRDVAVAGHAIGNHTWSHPSLPLLSGRARREEIRACARALAPYAGRLFRPPYGNQTVGSRLDAARLGYRVIGWSVSTVDWQDRDTDWLVGQLRDRLRPGCIVVLHDALHHARDPRYLDRSAVIEAVDRLLAALAGVLQFVTVPDLLRMGRPEYGRWFGRPDAALLASLRRASDVGGVPAGSPRP